MKNLVKSVRSGLATCSRSEGYEVVLATAARPLLDIAAFGLVRDRARTSPSGSSRASSAPSLQRAVPRRVLDHQERAGTRPTAVAEEGIDVYAWAHNETSTGVMTEVQRVAGAADDALVLIDATSGAGGLPVDVSQTDVYYFGPQKCFAADGGLWLALFSPAALARVDEITASGRWVPDFFSLPTALDNSRKDQTYNTPAVGTLALSRISSTGSTGREGAMGDRAQKDSSKALSGPSPFD